MLYLGGKEFKIIGTDGGLLERPRTATKFLLTPGERIDIAVGPFNEGESFPIESLGYNRSTYLTAKRQEYATVMVGELQIWEVSNTSLMDHPFHLHGFFFQVIEENGKASEYIAWKDTVNLKPRSKMKIAWMPNNRPGTWMYHCHILEHHAAGMMATFEVIDGNNPNEGTNPVQAHHH